MILKIIVGVYCIAGLLMNLIVLPVRNKDIHKDNDYILKRFEHMERLMKQWEETHSKED